MNNLLNQSEWNIMEELWEKNPRTMMELFHSLKEKTGWSKSTVITLLSRMVEKGIVSVEEGGKAKIYYPKVKREEAVMAETNSLIKRIFNGSVGLMISTLVENNSLTDEDIKELRDMLGKAGKPYDRD